MNRRRNWLKISVWIAGFVLIVGLGLLALSFILLRRTPDWYQPDETSSSQRHSAAGAFTKVLVDIHNWGSGRHAADVRAKQDLEHANAQTAKQAKEILNQKPDQTYVINFTDAQLNAFFDEWADARGRREWFDQYVHDPRLIMRENQLIVAGKAREMDMVVSVVFEPKLDGEAKLEMNLSHVLGGILPLPDAMWSGQRESLKRTLERKLPLYQEDANINSDGIANGDAGSAAMNQMLLATLNYKPASAVIFVPIDLKGLSESLPVKITGIAIHDHAVSLTVQQMSGDERTAFLKQLKTSSDNSVEHP